MEECNDKTWNLSIMNLIKEVNWRYKELQYKAECAHRSKVLWEDKEGRDEYLWGRKYQKSFLEKIPASFGWSLRDEEIK